MIMVHPLFHLPFFPDTSELVAGIIAKKSRMVSPSHHHKDGHNEWAGAIQRARTTVRLESRVSVSFGSLNSKAKKNLKKTEIELTFNVTQLQRLSIFPKEELECNEYPCLVLSINPMGSIRTTGLT